LNSPTWANRHAVTERLRWEVGVVTADDPGFFEGAYPTQTGRRRRNTNPFCEFDISHSPVGQQTPQNAAVDTVKSDSPHPGALPGLPDHRNRRFGERFCCAGLPFPCRPWVVFVNEADGLFLDGSASGLARSDRWLPSARVGTA